MNFKKIMKGAVVSALALVAAGTLAISASAAEESKTTASFDPGRSMRVSTTDEGAAQILVAYPKIDKKGNVKVKEWDTYELKNNDSGVTVPLAHVKTTKESYIAVRSNVSTAASLYQIPKDTTKAKAKYVIQANDKTKEAEAVINVTTGSSTSTVDAENVYVGEGYGYTLANFMESDISMCQQQGATLYLSVKGTMKGYGPEGGEPSSNTAKAKADGWAKDVKGYTCYDVTGTFNSAQVKVKIAKLASAPKVNPDYNKLTVKVSNKQEYRLYNYGEAVPAEWTVASEKSVTVSFGELAKKGKGVIEVRTKTDGKKKLASKIGRFDFYQVETPEVVDDTAADSATGKKLADLAVTVGEAEKASKCAITAKNSGSKTYTVTVVGAKNGKDIVKTVKANASVALLKDKADAGYEIKVSVAGDKKNGVLASGEASLGKIGK